MANITKPKQPEPDRRGSGGLGGPSPPRKATAVAASVISRPENSNFPGDDDDDEPART